MEQVKSGKILFGEGAVWHSRPESASQQFGFFAKIFRRFKISNSFRYPIFNLLIPAQSSEDLKKMLEKKSFISVRAENYLENRPGSLQDNISEFLRKEFSYSCDRVFLQTMPRIFGYVFNPVSFWYCYKDNSLDAVLCEVNNTFGDRHFYFVKSGDLGADKKAPKRFHVSPFMDISGYYTFEFQGSDKNNYVRICLFDEDHRLKLDTHIRLQFRDLDQVSNFYILKKYGLLTVMVMARIHFQALKLWLKGARFYHRPQPPEEKVTHDSASIQ